MWAAKRGVLEIIVSILNSLAEGPLRKTHVTYKARLDSRTTSKYIMLLLGLEMIAKSDDDPSYFTLTQKGRDFIEEYEGLIKIVGVTS